IAVSTSIAWNLAIQQQLWLEDSGYLAGEFHRLAVLLLHVVPVRNPVLDVGQATFGYIAVRIMAYMFEGVVTLVLPAIAAGSIGNDLMSGRLQDLRTTSWRPMQIILSKLAAISIPPLGLAVFVMLPFSTIAVGEGETIADLARVWLEVAS